MIWFGKFSRIGVISLTAVLVLASIASAAGGSQWPSAGNNIYNTRWQDSNTKIDPANASTLTVQWQVVTDGGVSATPAVDGQNVYFPDFAGNLYAVDRKTGALAWSHQIGDYTGLSDDFARTTPAIVGKKGNSPKKLIFGDQAGRLFNPEGSGTYVMAVDAMTGELLWKTLVDSHPFAIVTQSAVVKGADVYVGVSSMEEAAAALIPGYPCCSFRASVLKLDADTGAIQWKTYMVPEGYSGGAVWGSTPVVDQSRNSLFVANGNNYSVPQSVTDCVEALGPDPADEDVEACVSPDDHFDSVLALDLDTGAVKWATRALPIDAWNVNCVPYLLPGLPSVNPDQCPNLADSPDYDFGQGPALFTAHTTGGKNVDLLGVGQKSSQYWALDPDTGTVVWVTQVGPGGVGGGLQWGSATDGKRIYTAEANSESKPWTLPSGDEVTGGFWSALDAYTGEILWQTADPQNGGDPGAVSGSNGVVFGCSAGGDMHALDANTGEILWSFDSDNTCYGGAAVVDGTVYWGTGYATFGPPTPGALFAFMVP
jgi:polyvinyl alcohol dehydrogenase (cytochrome)